MSYLVPVSTVEYETEVKRSRFITYVLAVKSRSDAEGFVREIRKQHPQARHVCWAYIAGSPSTTEMSMSDDGEPSGTAGKPMLNVLIHSGIGEIAVAVVRYFGGIKLGTGGLQRAYSDAVSGALALLKTEVFVRRECVKLKFDYAHEPVVRYVLGLFDAKSADFQYGEGVSCTVEVALCDLLPFKEAIVNQSAGKVECVFEGDDSV